MAEIRFLNTTIHSFGELPEVGEPAPDFLLTDQKLRDKTLSDFGNQFKIINIVPSLDTDVCATSARQFDLRIENTENCVVLTVSADLPFAQSRFCKTEELKHVITLSQLRSRDFGRDYGVELKDGPMAGLLARAVVVLNTDNTIIYKELVSDITNEPDYDAAIAAISEYSSGAM